MCLDTSHKGEYVRMLQEQAGTYTSCLLNSETWPFEPSHEVNRTVDIELILYSANTRKPIKRQKEKQSTIIKGSKQKYN